MNAELSQFIQRHAAEVSPEDVEKLIRILPALRLRAARTVVPASPQFAEQVDFLSLALEDCAVGLNWRVPYVTMAEMAFALLYLKRETDIIPDSIPEIGLLDDAAILSLVLHRHEMVLRTHPLAAKLAWPVQPVDIGKWMGRRRASDRTQAAA